MEPGITTSLLSLTCLEDVIHPQKLKKSVEVEETQATVVPDKPEGLLSSLTIQVLYSKDDSTQAELGTHASFSQLLPTC
jgi:hypothetical protein